MIDNVLGLPRALVPGGDLSVESPKIWAAKAMAELCAPGDTKQQERAMQAALGD